MPIQHDVETSSSVGFGSLHGGVSEPEGDFGQIFDLQVSVHTLTHFHDFLSASTRHKSEAWLSQTIGNIAVRAAPV